MLTFHSSTDIHSEDIRRGDTLIGYLQWHRSQGPRITLWEKGCVLSLDELLQCTNRLATKNVSPLEQEIGRKLEHNCRLARVDINQAAGPDDGQFAVFKQSYYWGRWYYDGLIAFKKLANAVRYRDDWLRGENPDIANYQN